MFMNVPADDEHATMFWLDDGSTSGREAFVDPYTGKVLGSTGAGGGSSASPTVCTAYLNNDTIQISLPTIAALWMAER